MENYLPAEGVKSVADEIGVEMAAFDQLPLILREILREAPVEVSAVQTLNRYRHDGMRATKTRIARALKLYLEASV